MAFGKRKKKKEKEKIIGYEEHLGHVGKIIFTLRIH